MKKLLLSLLGLAMVLSAPAQGILSTNITAGAGVHLLTTNRLNVYAIEVGTTNAFTFRFYDNDNTTSSGSSLATPGFWGTNVVTGSYISRVTYPTNYLETFTNYSGYVNYKTNVGLWTLTTTNAQATNVLSTTAIVNTGGAESRVVYVNALFKRGVVFGSTGNGNITLYYRPE